jgi:hypothetical protein
MMSLINLLLNVLFLFPLFILCTESNSPFPLAITLGPSHIFASWITQSGEIKVSRYLAGDIFIAYFNNTLIHHGEQPNNLDIHNEDVATSTIRDAIKSISQDLSKTLGYKPIFAALFLPSVFNSSSLSAASTALFPNGRMAKDGPKKLGYVATAASFAYRLDQCDNLSVMPIECENIDNRANLILIIEYEKHYLYLHLVDVDPEAQVFPPLHHEFAKEFRELSGIVLRDVGYSSRLEY